MLPEIAQRRSADAAAEEGAWLDELQRNIAAASRSAVSPPWPAQPACRVFDQVPSL